MVDFIFNVSFSVPVPVERKIYFSARENTQRNKTSLAYPSDHSPSAESEKCQIWIEKYFLICLCKNEKT